MISKERLEELIEQGATIYGKIYGDILAIELSKKNKPEIKYDDRLDVYCTSNEWRNKMQFCYLWETEEDARWELEMTATRTETLKLPNYEDVFKQDRCLDCYTREFAITKTDIVMGVCLFGVDFTNKVVEVSVGADKMFTGELTKENYIEACKLCLKLFKGEEV